MARYYQVLLFLMMLPWVVGCASNGRTKNLLAPGGHDAPWAEGSPSRLREMSAGPVQHDSNLYVIDTEGGHVRGPGAVPEQVIAPPAPAIALTGMLSSDCQGSAVSSPQPVRAEEVIADLASPNLAPELKESPPPLPRPVVGSDLQTINDFENWALSTNPVVLQQQAKLRSLQGRLVQVGLKPNPVVGVSGQDINESGVGGMYGVYFGRELVRGNKLQLARSVVGAEIKVAQQQLNEMTQRLTTDIRVGFYDLLVAQRKLELANQLAEIAETAALTSEKLFAAKEVARSAVLQAQMERQNTVVLQGQAVNEEAAARRKLAALVGEPTLLKNKIKGDLQQVSDLADFEHTYDRLITESPELAKLFENIERARRQLQRECAEPISNVTWQATVQYDTVGETVVSGFQVGFPIPKFNRNQGAIRQAEHDIAVAEFQVEKKALELRQRLAGAYERYLQAKLQVNVYSENILPKAKSTFELISEGYRQGEVDFVSFLTAQRTYFDANLAYVSGLKQLWQEHNLIQGLLLSASLRQEN